MIRQGDVLLIEVGSIPKGAKPVPRDDRGRLVLALGEVTGHAHVVTTVGTAPASEATLLTASENRRFLRLMAPAELVHEEHATIPLAPGLYEQIRQEEWTDAMALHERITPIAD